MTGETTGRRGPAGKATGRNAARYTETERSCGCATAESAGESRMAEATPGRAWPKHGEEEKGSGAGKTLRTAGREKCRGRQRADLSATHRRGAAGAPGGRLRKAQQKATRRRAGADGRKNESNAGKRAKRKRRVRRCRRALPCQGQAGQLVSRAGAPPFTRGHARSIRTGCAPFSPAVAPVNAKRGKGGGMGI